jgi:hypothetical protein
MVAPPTKVESEQNEAVAKITKLLESKGESVGSVISELAQKYPAGFLLLYSDGREIAHYEQVGMGVDIILHIDGQGKWKTAVTGDTLALLGTLTIMIGKDSYILDNMAFKASPGRTVYLQHLGIPAEASPITSSGKAAAWVIGISPSPNDLH